MIHLLFILQSNSGSLIANLLPFVLIILVFYLFFIRPQSKKQKEQRNFVEAVNKGDEIVLSSGIVGRINKIEGDTLTLQVDTKTYIKVVKGSVSKEMTDAYFASQEEKK